MAIPSGTEHGVRKQVARFVAIRAVTSQDGDRGLGTPTLPGAAEASVAHREPGARRHPRRVRHHQLAVRHHRVAAGRVRAARWARAAAVAIVHNPNAAQWAAYLATPAAMGGSGSVIILVDADGTVLAEAAVGDVYVLPGRSVILWRHLETSRRARIAAAEVIIDPTQVAWRRLPPELVDGVIVDRMRLDLQRSPVTGLRRFWVRARADSRLGVDLADPSFSIGMRDRQGRLVSGRHIYVADGVRALRADRRTDLEGGVFLEGSTQGVTGVEGTFLLRSRDLPGGLVVPRTQHDQ